MNETDILKSEVSINQIHKVLDLVVHADITPVLIGESGIGKTEAVRAYAEERKLHLIELNASQIFVEDFGGVRDDGDFIRFKPNKIFDVPGPTLLFIDEASRARGELRNLIMCLVNERKLYGQPISDEIRMVLAANPNSDDYADTEDLFGDLACARRFTCFIVNTDVDLWVEWAGTHGVTEKTRQFLLMNQLAMINGQSCPRQWVKIDKVYQKYGAEGVKLLGPGTLGLNWRFYYEHLTKLKVITADQVLKSYDTIQEEVKASRELQIALASELVNAKYKPIYRNNVVAFLLDLPQELIYSTCMKLLKNKANKIIFDWIDCNPKLKEFLEKDSNY